MPVFALFLIWPLVEIALFVTLGSALGLWLTLLVVLGTGALGVAILRGQGLQSADRLRQRMADLRNPLAVAGSDALRMLAGVLLILPGFLTDALGLLLLVPLVRLLIVAWLARRFSVASMQSDQPARRSDGIVIDGEFTEIDSGRADGGPRPPSGWTRH
ncbi:FxsA family protein [Paragemmobacter straminiformis]|uniref:FxsA family protein n=1 Tax=Paragemmobacter straminiformis TaxID=2045119 RepID=A0A842I9D8_9RHOB|nr:FxsA family protein [Gemmobacter straminiformis]MBC2836033.1 FxsA family protein [Gemmobacter straminiformis]